jgi:hypothetical protein
VADGLNVVPVKVQDEGPVVVGVVHGPEPRGPIILGPRLQRCLVECIHMRAAGGAKSEMNGDGNGLGRAGGHPEGGKAGSVLGHVAGQLRAEPTGLAGKVHGDADVEGGQDVDVELSSFLVTGRLNSQVVDHLNECQGWAPCQSVF